MLSTSTYRQASFQPFVGLLLISVFFFESLGGSDQEIHFDFQKFLPKVMRWLTMVSPNTDPTTKTASSS